MKQSKVQYILWDIKENQPAESHVIVDVGQGVFPGATPGFAWVPYEMYRVGNIVSRIKPEDSVCDIAIGVERVKNRYTHDLYSVMWEPNSKGIAIEKSKIYKNELKERFVFSCVNAIHVDRTKSPWAISYIGLAHEMLLQCEYVVGNTFNLADQMTECGLTYDHGSKSYVRRSI